MYTLLPSALKAQPRIMKFVLSGLPRTSVQSLSANVSFSTHLRERKSKRHATESEPTDTKSVLPGEMQI